MRDTPLILTHLMRHLQGAKVWALFFFSVWCASSYHLFDSNHIYTGDFAYFLEGMVIKVLLLLVWTSVFVVVEQAFERRNSVALHLCIGSALLAADVILTDLFAPWLFFALGVVWYEWVSELCSVALLTIAIDIELNVSLKSRSRSLLGRLSVVVLLLGCFTIFTFAQYQHDQRPPAMSLNANSSSAWIIKKDTPVVDFLNSYFSEKMK